MNYPTYTNNGQYYMQSLEDMRNRIDNQIRQYQQNQMQMQPVQQPITQNFQLAPTQNNTNELEAKYVNNVDEVKNTFVMKMGIFINKELDNLWIKDVNGSIRTFQLTEIIEQDPKDIEIQNLKNEIEKMKGMITNESSSINSNFDETDGNKIAKRVTTSKKSNAK